MLVAGCTATVPSPDRLRTAQPVMAPVRLPPPPPLPPPVQAQERPRAKAASPAAKVVRFNRALMRELERSVAAWLAPELTNLSIVFPDAVDSPAGTVATGKASDSLPTIVVHPAGDAVTTVETVRRDAY